MLEIAGPIGEGGLALPITLPDNGGGLATPVVSLPQRWPVC